MEPPPDPLGRCFIQRLPLELKTQVVKLLLFDKATVKALIRTCKSLYEVTLPLSIGCFRNTPPNQDNGFCSERRNAQFLRFILVLRPELAKSFDSIVLGRFASVAGVGYDVQPEDEAEGQIEDITYEEYSPEELVVYRKKIVELLPPGVVQQFAGEWIRDLERGCSDAQVALIIVSCPNIRSLYFETPYNSRHFLRVLLLYSSPITTPLTLRPFSQLRYIYSDACGGLRGALASTDTDRNIGPCFSLPGLHTFEGVNVLGGPTLGAWLQQLPPRSSSIEDIALRKSHICAHMLESMLARCSTLKRLEISRGFGRVRIDDVLPGEVIKAALPHASTLESLHFNMPEEWPQKVNPLRQVSSRFYMGTQLRQMTALKDLKTGMWSLVGYIDRYSPDDPSANNHVGPIQQNGAPWLVDCLPQNLERLEIMRCTQQILVHIRRLISIIHAGKGFLNLKNIKLLFNSESVAPEDVQLSYDTSILHIEVVFQTHENRSYDLIPCHWEDGHEIQSICSPIYAPDLRKQWLEIRGSDVGFAATRTGTWGMDCKVYLKSPLPGACAFSDENMSDFSE